MSKLTLLERNGKGEDVNDLSLSKYINQNGDTNYRMQ